MKKTKVHSSRTRSLAHHRSIFPLGTAFLLVLLVVSTLVALTSSSKRTTAQAASSFSFTAAGDYGQTNYTTANLKYIASSGVKFNLGLGDFSYDSSVNADQWSSYVKSYLGSSFPFEIVDGRHDTSQINKYAADLPNRISGMSGTYAKQYSFDYPSSAPLARFILISPSVLYNYTKGSANYNWVAQQIDSAHNAGIHWVIVGMHQYCFVIGTSSCPNQDLLDLLLTKKVDLILQGQKHDYQASKQLALNGTTCKTLSATSYNANCVVNATKSFTKGAGTVIVVTGTGGISPLLSVNTSDPKKGYFSTWMGANANPTWGLSQFAISATSLSEHFVGVSGSYSNSFTVNG